MTGGSVCGLTADGDIRCTSGIIVPDRGSYTALAINRAAICALDLNGALDCNLRNNDDATEYPLGEVFTSIQTLESNVTVTVFGPDGVILRQSGSTMCGERPDGSIDCWAQGSEFPDIDNPTAIEEAFLATINLELDARVYSATRVEVFHTPVRSPTSRPLSIEVYRNGVLIDTKIAGFSYFDTNAQRTNDYQLRVIDDAGNAGAFSETLSVNTSTNEVLFDGEAPFSPVAPDDTVISNGVVQNLNITGFVASWDIAPEAAEDVDGYLVSVDGATLGFTRLRLFVDTRSNLLRRCVRVTAVDASGSPVDIASAGFSCN